MKKRTLYELIGFAVLAIVMLCRFAMDMPKGEPQVVQETTVAVMQAQSAQGAAETVAEFAVTDSESKAQAAQTMQAAQSAETKGAAVQNGDGDSEDDKTPAETEPENAQAAQAESTAATAQTAETEAVKADTLPEDGAYTDRDSVALYIATYGHLPSNFITKKKAEEAGWDSKAGNLDEVCPGMSIGGSRFGNYEGQLPDKKGRKYFECDINYNPKKGRRGAERIVYSNDGLVYYTGDHYNTFELLYGEP